MIHRVYLLPYACWPPLPSSHSLLVRMFKVSDNDFLRDGLHRSVLFLRGQQQPSSSSSSSSSPSLSSSPSTPSQPPSAPLLDLVSTVPSKIAKEESLDLPAKPRPWRYVRWRKAHEKLIQPSKEKKDKRGNIYHRVLPDEDLFEVAAKYLTYPEAVMEANHILNPVNIATGQILWIPRTHLIQWGNTLWSLSGKYGVSIPSIQHANGITDPDLIFAGDIIRIPEEPEKNTISW